MRPLPAILCIDVEPDGRTLDPQAPAGWGGFESIVESIERLREEASGTAAPAHFTWLFRMDPQVAMVYGSPSWAAEQYAATIEGLQHRGDELGLHLHPWRWIAERSQWVQDFADPLWVEHCLETSFSAFERRFGKRCATFRFGDRWMNTATLRSLARRGVRYDLTMEPGPVGWFYPLAPIYRWTFPDCSVAPRAPYRPSPLDFRLPGRLRPLPLWMIPISTAVATPRAVGEVVNAAGAAIEIDPPVSMVDEPWSRATVTVRWRADATAIDIRIESPYGVLFTGGGSEGSATTGNWVADGMRFFLQDVTTGETLAVAAAEVRPRRNRRSVADRLLHRRKAPPARGEWFDLNVGCHPDLLPGLIERLLGNPETQHLALHTRSDAGLEKNREALRSNLAVVASLVREGTIALVRPDEAVRALQPRNGG
jgi:hypothetical protein